MPRPDRKPDAVLFPAGMFRKDNEEADPGAIGTMINRHFGPILGVARLNVHGPIATQPFNFGYAFDRRPQTLGFSIGTALAGRPRYDWYPAQFVAERKGYKVANDPIDDPRTHSDTVMFGWLKENADENPDTDVLMDAFDLRDPAQVRRAGQPVERKDAQKPGLILSGEPDLEAAAFGPTSGRPAEPIASPPEDAKEAARKKGASGGTTK